MIKKFLLFVLAAVLLLIFWAAKPSPVKPDLKYGASFSVFHSNELKLDWKKTYLAMLDDLKIRRLRLTAHWPMIEPERGKFNFSELDFQIHEAEKRNATVILAIGRRLPGWPECHTPDWADKLPLEQQRLELNKMFETIVTRYKDSKSLLYWQVENEQFLAFFSRSLCEKYSEGSIESLNKKIDLVKKIDPNHPILITDSGEFGTWYKAYNTGDVFGTSMYLYVWWRNMFGPIRYPITPAFFRVKHNITKLIFGDKPALVIELSTEPWLLQPIVDTPIETQLERMGLDKFNEMIDFSSQTGFDTFYLWGAEWWYWLKQNGHSEFWARAKEIYNQNNSVR